MQVEVWDIVDVAKKRKKLTGLKVGGSEGDEFEQAGLDAQFLDVYKQTHGVIIVFDITKPWTLDYAKKELGHVPSSIPVLILANFSDMSHHRQVTQLQISDFIESYKRDGPEPAEVRTLRDTNLLFTESSLIPESRKVDRFCTRTFEEF